MALNEDKLNEFLGRFVTDLGATVAAGNVMIGHQLGLYKALATGPVTAEELTERTRTHPQYIAEWLRGQAAGRYVEYDAASDTYSMTGEQAFGLTNPDGAVQLLQLRLAPGEIPALAGKATTMPVPPRPPPMTGIVNPPPPAQRSAAQERYVAADQTIPQAGPPVPTSGGSSRAATFARCP